MNSWRETEEDKRKQRRLFEVFAKHKGMNFKEFSPKSGKYRIDGFLYNHNNTITAWVECKWYNGKAHLYLNVAKYNELISLSNISDAPSYLLFREGNRWGFVKIGDCGGKIKLAGGTPKGRKPNKDDVEPLVCLDREDIIWGN